MKLKYINSDYVPKGQLEGFPLEVIDKMLERQVEQGSLCNVEVFEIYKRSDKRKKGFDWSKSLEEYDFWEKVILDKNFDTFFEKYPKEEKTFPRIIEVYSHLIGNWIPRVCIKMINGTAICWKNAYTFEEAEKVSDTKPWTQWREVQEEKEPEYKPFDFSDGVKNYDYLLGKKLISKNGETLIIINKLDCFGSNNHSFINSYSTKSICENYTFINGEPAGVKINKNE